MEKGRFTTILRKVGHDKKSVAIWSVSFVLVLALIAGLGVLVTSGGEGKVSAQTTSSAPKAKAGNKAAKAGGPVAMLAGKEAMEATASFLGINVTELQKQLASGKTILEIAKSKGISEDKLKSELKKKMNEAIDKAAKTAKSKLDDFVSNFVKNGPRSRGGAAGVLRVQVPETVASVLGMSSADLIKELQSGKTITQVAQEKNVPIETVTAALKQKLTELIDQAVKNGKLDATRAATMKTKLDTMVQNMINRQPGKGKTGMGPNGEAPPEGAPIDQPAGEMPPIDQLAI